MSKHNLLALTLAGLVSVATVSAVAQSGNSTDQQSVPPAQSAPAGNEGAHGHRQFDPEKRAEMLGKHLKLTSDQQGKVLDILKSEQSQMESLHSDTSTSQEDRRSKMMDIHKTSNEQIRALLNADQQKKFDEMEAHRGQWGNHQGGADNATPPSDSQK
jgi:periplasmic protein CpxP/Spy